MLQISKNVSIDCFSLFVIFQSHKSLFSNYILGVFEMRRFVFVHVTPISVVEHWRKKNYYTTIAFGGRLTSQRRQPRCCTKAIVYKTEPIDGNNKLIEKETKQTNKTSKKTITSFLSNQTKIHNRFKMCTS